MKSILFLILSLLLISSCYILPELPDWEIPKDFSSIDEALTYLSTITYIPDKESDWQTPEETYKRRAGDCEDINLLFLHILTQKLNISSSLCLGTYDSAPHAWVSINSVYYEGIKGSGKVPTLFLPYYQLNYKMSYDSALRTAVKQ